MKPRLWLFTLTLAGSMTSGAAARAQTFAAPEPMLQRIWAEGHERSQIVPLAQTLLDSLGPRLTGSPGSRAAQEWMIGRYAAWGIPARNEQYGTWRAWRRGITHVDLLEPRVRTLEATMLAWSPGTAGPVSGEVVVLPETGFPGWLPTIRGKYVLISQPQPTCRPDDSWEEFATPASLERMREARAAERAAWARRLQASGLGTLRLIERLEQAGAAGILTSSWSSGWGVNKVYEAYTRSVPMLDVSCEDYGLLARLALNRQGPVLRVNAQSESLGEQPVFNTIAEIRGTEKPDEYVMLSAHFDSWDGASGATDNGTGTLTMMEAMRILQEVYPRPKRTIRVGHWSGEEQGLNGSQRYVADHPEVVSGMQALFNQDNGTGRIVGIGMKGFAGAGAYFQRWMARLPREIAEPIRLDIPGLPGGGGTDDASFVCAGVPGFTLSSLSWEYNAYTWHTNRDTFDKLSFDDLRNNAVLTAMLAYLASEEPERIPRDRAPNLVNPRTGAPVVWPTCQPGARSSGDPR